MDGEAYSLILRRLAALERRLSAVFRTGKVESVRMPTLPIATRDDTYAVRVDIGPDDDGRPVLTDWLPVQRPRAGEVGDWTPLTVGERVGVLAPGGEDTAAFVMPGLPSEDFSERAESPRTELRRFSVLGDPSTEAARIEVTRGDTVEASRMRLLVGAYGLVIGGDGHVRILRDQMDTQVP